MGTQNSFEMVLRCVTLVGFLVPVLVIPLGLLALRVLGVVAFYMMVEPAQISVRYSLSVAAVSLSALCGVVDVSLLGRRVVDILRVFWVRVLVVVAPVALWRSGGLSLAAGWMAAASAPALVPWANLARSFVCAAGSGSGRLVVQAQRCFEWLLRAAPVVRGSLRVRHPRWLFLCSGSAVWPFSFGAAAVLRSEVQLRACVRCNSRSGSHWMAVAVIMLGMLPRSEAVGDPADLAAALLTAAGSGGFLWLVVPEKADSRLLYGMVFSLLVFYVSQWLTVQQEPVARQYAPQCDAVSTVRFDYSQPRVYSEGRWVLLPEGYEPTKGHTEWWQRMQQKWQQISDADRRGIVTAVKSVLVAALSRASEAQVASARAVQIAAQREIATPARKGWKHLRRARYYWQLQQAQLLIQQWRTQRFSQQQMAVGAAAEHQPTVVEKQPAAAEDGLAVRRGSKRRHRIRLRANGAPRSCVLQSGRWINLLRARRAANDTIAAVQVRKQQHKQQRQCRFNDSGSGCRRSQCKYAPAGHSPAVDGPDVLDPLVAAKLESLVGSVQAGLEQRQQEQLQRLQLQQQRSVEQLRLQLGQQEQQLQSLRDEQWQQQQQHQHQAMEGGRQQLRQQNNEIKEIQASCEQQKAKYLRGAISSLQAEIHNLKQNVALSHPFEVEMRHAVEDIGRIKATFTRRGIALSMLNVANTQ